ncbi:MAG: 30S ribosomal protein S2, partial [Clostridia bacterium]|nr:30S ribosomal protein S2 [Clostridia bacterium]
FKTMRSRVEYHEKLEAMEANGDFEHLHKKEVILLKKEMGKLQANLGGIKTMKSMPGVMFVVDPHNEDIAIKEAKKLGIKIVAITDTNCDPDEIDYVIPGNDDAIRAIKLIASVIANAVIEANQGEEAIVATATEEVAEEKAPESIEEVVANEEA